MPLTFVLPVGLVLTALDDPFELSTVLPLLFPIVKLPPVVLAGLLALVLLDGLLFVVELDELLPLAEPVELDGLSTLVLPVFEPDGLLSVAEPVEVAGLLPVVDP